MSINTALLLCMFMPLVLLLLLYLCIITNLKRKCTYENFCLLILKYISNVTDLQEVEKGLSWRQRIHTRIYGTIDGLKIMRFYSTKLASRKCIIHRHSLAEKSNFNEKKTVSRYCCEGV